MTNDKLQRAVNWSILVALWAGFAFVLVGSLVGFYVWFVYARFR